MLTLIAVSVQLHSQFSTQIDMLMVGHLNSLKIKRNNGQNLLTELDVIGSLDEFDYFMLSC